MSIDSDTQWFGVIGDPIHHSLSPDMLNAAFEETGYNAVYAAFHVKADDLEAAVHGIKALNGSGFNVTIPHKVDVMRYLDEIDTGAKVIGAVNTVLVQNGRMIGTNTDGIGYVRSLKEECGLSLNKGRVLVLGAGGAARGIVYALLQEHPEKLWIANRTESRALALADDMKMYGNVQGIALEHVHHGLNDIDFIVNTTSAGMYPHVNHTPMDPQLLHSRHIVSDIVYRPQMTKWLLEAQKRGCQIHSGLGMFIYQGAYAFEYWTGKSAPVQVMRDIVKSKLNEA